MKTLSITLLVLTTVQAALTGDGTALIVAFVLFCRECGKDVVNLWNKLIPDNYETYR